MDIGYIKQKIENNSDKFASLCAIVKNENRYLKEWVDYYLSIGFSSIFICDNNDIGGEHIEDVLNTYIVQNKVFVINFRGVHKKLSQEEAVRTGYHGTQQDAYEFCYNNFGVMFKWMAFFDIDEFLTLDSKFKNITEFLSQKCFDDTFAIQINWRTYGDSGLVKYENKPVLQRFTKPSKKQTKHIKTICRTQKNGVQLQCHRAVLENAVYRRPNGKKTTCGYKQEINYEGAYIKHFFTKTIEEWCFRKLNATSATGKDYFNKKESRINEFFLFNERTKEKIAIANRSFIHMESEKHKVIVSLTSYSNRLKRINETLKSLFNQTYKANKIVLTVFKDDEPFINQETRKYINDGLIDLIVVDENLRPHLKYFFAMQKYPDCAVVTVDDDIVYDNNVLQRLVESYLKFPNAISACRVHEIKYGSNRLPIEYNKWAQEVNAPAKCSFNLFATGVGGVLYPPSILKLSQDNISDIKKCLLADDIYLKWLENKLNIPVVHAGNIGKIPGRPMTDVITQQFALCKKNTQQGGNDVYLRVFKLYKDNKQPKTIGLNKKVVYTCITGKYDTLHNPSFVTDDFDYICFTDNMSLTSDIWDIRPLPDVVKDLSQVKKQRFVKINPHIVLPEYEESIWVDGNVDIKDDINVFIKEKCNRKDSSIFIPTHPYRKCLYSEAQTVMRIGKDKKEIVNKQINRYKKEGFPANYGLPQSNIIYRKHNNEDCKKLMGTWWNELSKESHRDQLSFSYAMWKNQDVKVTFIDKDIYKSRWFKWSGSHVKQKDASTPSNVITKVYAPKSKIVSDGRQIVRRSFHW